MASTADIDINRDIQGAPRVADFVIDADQHVNPPPTIWSEYLSPQFRPLAPTIEAGDDDCDYVVFEGSRRKLHILGATAGRSVEQYKLSGRLADMRLANWMAPERLVDMDRDGIDQAVIFGGGPLQTQDFELYLDSFAGYNRWVADFCSHDARRLFHVAYVPMIDVETSVRMIREAKASGAVAVNIPAFPQSASTFNKTDAQAQALTGDQHGGRQYMDREFDPLWAVSCELDIPLTIHLGGRVSRFNEKRFFLLDMPMSRLCMLEVIGTLIYGGVFDRFPDLRIGIIESGVGWMPWAATFMDRSWSMQKYWTETEIAHPPSYYFDTNIYGSYVADPVGVMLRHMPGCKNIMWSSDYPHSETTFPTSHETIASDFAGVPDEERDWIIAGCARKFFGLGEP